MVGHFSRYGINVVIGLDLYLIIVGCGRQLDIRDHQLDNSVFGLDLFDYGSNSFCFLDLELDHRHLVFLNSFVLGIDLLHRR